MKHLIRRLSLLALTVSLGCVPTFASKGTLNFADYPYTSVSDEPWPEHDIVLDSITEKYGLGIDARVHYIELNPEGDKTVVFVHGLGSYLKFWRYQVDAFAAKGYRVLALDMIGYGKSVKPASFPYTMESMAEVVRAFVKAKGLDRPVLAGHSMGGHTSLVYAINYPDELSALVLTAPAGFEKFSAKEREWFRSVVTVGLIKSAPESALWGSIRRNNFWRWSDDYLWLIEERARVRSSDEFDQYAYANVKSIQGLTYTEFTRQSLGAVRVPTMIIFGDKDRLIPSRFMHGAPTRVVMNYGHRGIANSELVELEGCGHSVQLDCHDEYNERVLGFLGEQELRKLTVTSTASGTRTSTTP